MFRFPIAPSLRTVAPPIIPRARASIPPSELSRLFSTPSSRIQSTRPTTIPRSSRYISSRFFASSTPRFYPNGYRYRRFDGPKGEPFVFRLIRNAKPIHFVIVGGVIGGFYVYNTETVEVGNPPCAYRTHLGTCSDMVNELS